MENLNYDFTKASFKFPDKNNSNTEITVPRKDGQANLIIKHKGDSRKGIASMRISNSKELSRYVMDLTSYILNSYKNVQKVSDPILTETEIPVSDADAAAAGFPLQEIVGYKKTPHGKPVHNKNIIVRYIE